MATLNPQEKRIEESQKANIEATLKKSNNSLNGKTILYSGFNNFPFNSLKEYTAARQIITAVDGKHISLDPEQDIEDKIALLSGFFPGALPEIKDGQPLRALPDRCYGSSFQDAYNHAKTNMQSHNTFIRRERNWRLLGCPKGDKYFSIIN